MPFKQVTPGSAFYILTMEYGGRKYSFRAEFHKFNNLKQYWYIHANEGLLALSYHVQTKILKQETTFGKAIPADFLAVLQHEFQSRQEKIILRPKLYPERHRKYKKPRL